jgi:hypothetical protein
MHRLLSVPQTTMRDKIWGKVKVFRVPSGYPDLPERPTDDEVKSMLMDRRSWENVGNSNTCTEFGKDYLWGFALRGVSRDTQQPLFATDSAESDDYITRMAFGDGATGAPDPSAFTEANDRIASYRGRGRVIRAISMDPAIVPHAFEVLAAFSGTDVVLPSVSSSPFSMNEAALVTATSDDHNGTYPGNKVIAYCTFVDEPIPVALTDRFSIQWVVGIS